jgi:hypothetical protein
MKTFKLFLLLLWLNIKILYRDLKKKLKTSASPGMLLLIIPRSTQKGLSELNFLLDMLCTIIIVAGAGMLLLSLAQWIIGQKKNAQDFLLLASAIIIIGIFILIIKLMMKQ